MLALFLVLGTAGMIACAIIRRRRYAISVFTSVLFCLCLTCVGVAGAKLMFAMENGMRDWSGVSFFGSVFLVPVLMPLVGLLFRLRPWQSLDLCAPCVAIMISCLRINCFISGCCGANLIIVSGYRIMIPVQLLEATLDLVILVVLLFWEKRGMMKKNFYQVFMIAYGVLRFFIEFVRATPKDWLGMSHGQWFSLLSIAIGIVWWCFVTKGKKNDIRT